MTYLRASCLNFTISLSICQKYGFTAFFFCANRLDKPYRLPHSQPWPLSKLTENDISDASISTPRLSKKSIIFGYVTCPISKLLLKGKWPLGERVCLPPINTGCRKRSCLCYSWIEMRLECHRKGGQQLQPSILMRNQEHLNTT